MTLKNRYETPYGGWVFYFVDRNGSRIKVTGGNLGSLVAAAREQMIRNEIQPPSGLMEEVEHQICVRQPGGMCWSSGVGDSIHSGAKKLGAVIARLVPAMSGAVESITSCGSCGGHAEFKQGRNNMGRASTLNKIFKLTKK